MRTYEPIWETLKKDNRISITAHPSQHKRVIKAVIKEKWMDSVFKYQCSEINLTTKLSYIRDNTSHKITFLLTYHGIGEI